MITTTTTKPKRTRLYVRRFKSIGFVDKGACEGAEIIIAKRHETDADTLLLKTENLAVPVDRARANERVRDVAWQMIAKLGEVEQAKDPTLSPEAARLRAIDTPAARPFAELYRHPDANLSTRAFVEKQKREADRVERIGVATWREYVSKRAREIAAMDTSNKLLAAKIVDAYAVIRRDQPAVWAEYERERAGR